MPGKRLNTALIGLLVLGLVVPTGAALPTLTDNVFRSNDLVLKPYDGPNGQTYVHSVEDTRPDVEGQNITINISSVNLNAKTIVENVFVIENQGDSSISVWIEHDATQYLTVQRSDTHESIEGQANRVNLSAGERIVVGFTIDTRDADLERGDLLLETITIHAGELASGNSPPSAALSAPNRVQRGTSFTLDASDSSDPDGDTLTYTWDLDGDGQFDDASGVTVETATTNFPYEVTLRVTDEAGATATVSKTIRRRSPPDTATPTPPPPSSPTPTTTPTPTPTATSTPTNPETPTVESPATPTTPALPTTQTSIDETVDVDLGGDDDVEVTVTELDQIPGGDDRGPPRARIQNVDQLRQQNRQQRQTQPNDDGGGGEATDRLLGGDRSRQVERALKAVGANAVTEVGRPITLSGAPSIIRSSQGITQRGRVVKAVDIRVPASRQNQEITIRLRIRQSRFPAGSNPENAQIGHYTGEGWQLLETKVIRENDAYVIVQANASSFSPFAVFAENNVRYVWTLPDGTRVQGLQARPTFNEIGMYNVTLTVIDAFGQSDSTDYRILVNDPPEPTIEISNDVEPGEPVTLRANVSDSIGDITSVVWIFEDGTTIFNETVTIEFGPGEHTVRVAVQDEFGSIGNASTTIQAGGNLPSGQPEPTSPSIPNAGAIALIGLGSAFTFLSGRWAYPGNIAILRPVSPRVSVLRNPYYNDGTIRIEELVVEDPNGDLERVTISILDAAETPVVEKQIELDPTSTYESRPERIRAPFLKDEASIAGYRVMVQAFDAKDHASRKEFQDLTAS